MTYEAVRPDFNQAQAMLDAYQQTAAEEASRLYGQIAGLKAELAAANAFIQANAERLGLVQAQGVPVPNRAEKRAAARGRKSSTTDEIQEQ